MLRAFIIVLLCLGTVLPKATATLAVILPGSFTSIVICTGSGVAVIALDQTGTPMEGHEIHGLDCLADTTLAPRDAMAPAWHRLARIFGPAPAARPARTAAQDPEDLPSRGRAPPVLAPLHLLI